MINKLLKSIVERSEDTDRIDEIVEEGYFVFQDPESDGSIMVPYRLKEDDDFETERDKAAAMIENKGIN